MREKYPHVVVGVFVYTDDGRIAMVKSPKWPGLWVVPGGHIDSGELVEDAVKREAKEEIGIDVYDLKFVRLQELLKTEYNTKMPHLISFHFACKTKTEDLLIDKNEITEYKWFTFEDALSSNETTDYIKGTIRLIRDKKWKKLQ